MREPRLLRSAATWLDNKRRLAQTRLRSLLVEPGAWLQDRASRSRHRTLDESQLRALSRSDTCFIFGSGRSLDDISPGEWEAIAQHNTVGFNYFIRSSFVRVDFHVVGEMASSDDLRPSVWRPVVAEYARLIDENPFYANTVLGLQEGLRALQSNRLSASPSLRPGRRVFRYRRIARGVLAPPTSSLSEGLVHGAGTLVGCINLAVILGFREIVLAGIDLYDRRRFSLAENPTPTGPFAGAGQDLPHATASEMVKHLSDWGPRLLARGITLSVYNPHSLLAQVLPIKRRLA